MSSTTPISDHIGLRRIWAIAWPIIISSATQTALNVTDTAFIGRLGAIPLGAGAIGGIIYLTVIMFAWGFGVGTQIVVARRLGEGRVRMVGRTVTHAFIFQWSMALVLFTVLMVGREPIMRLLVSSDAVRGEAVGFLSYRLWGIFFAHTNFAFRSLYVGLGRTKILSLTSGVMVAVNIVLDYLLVFGIGPFPEMGIRGAALASAIAELCCTAVFIVATQIKIDAKRYSLFRFRVLSFRLIGRLIRVAIPVMAQNFFTILSWLLFFLIIERLGEAELATSNIVRSLYIVMQIPLMGFNSAANTLVSYQMGRGRVDDVIPLIWRVARVCLLLVAVFVAIPLLFPGWALSIYTDQPSLIDMGRPLIPILVTSSLIMSIGTVLFSGISGTGRTSHAFAIEGSVVVVYLAVAFTLGSLLHMPLRVVWMSDVVYSLLLVGVCLCYLKWGRWREANV